MDDEAIRAARGPFAGTRGQLDAPYFPTSATVVEQMLDLAAVGPGDRLIDLGCGDGRIVIAAAKRGAIGLGVDVDPAQVKAAREAALEAGVERSAQFRAQDLFRTSLADATVVTLFLLGHVNSFLEERLRTRLRPGARVVSHLFPMPRSLPERVLDAGERRFLYLWVVPIAE